MSEAYLARCNKFLDAGQLGSYRQCMMEYKASGLAERVASGTASEEEKADYRIWSPFLVPIEPLTLEKMLLLVVVAKYLKEPAGRKQLADLAKKYLDTVGDTMSSLAQAGASHPFASLVHGKIAVAVYETLGLIQPLMARTLMSNMEDCINKIMAEKVLSDITGMARINFGSTTKTTKAE